MTSRARITIRQAEPSDAPKLHVLIMANQAEGHLLPRSLADVTARIAQFTVAVRNRQVVGGAELAALSPHVAEVRSLAVHASARGNGIGGRLVDELRARARREGFDRLCAFTHRPGYFVQMGFSIVPHLWLTEKVYTDCVRCPGFRRCGQFAMVLPLEPAVEPADHDATLVARHA